MTEVSVPPAWLDRLVWALALVCLTAMLALGAFAFLFAHRMTHSRRDSTRMDAQSVRSAATMFVIENDGECPVVHDLTSGGYLDSGRRTTDGWDNAFQIRCEGYDVIVTSAGPDGRHGTTDDSQ